MPFYALREIAIPVPSLPQIQPARSGLGNPPSPPVLAPPAMPFGGHPKGRPRGWLPTTTRRRRPGCLGWFRWTDCTVRTSIHALGWPRGRDFRRRAPEMSSGRPRWASRIAWSRDLLPAQRRITQATAGGLDLGLGGDGDREFSKGVERAHFPPVEILVQKVKP